VRNVGHDGNPPESERRDIGYGRTSTVTAERPRVREEVGGEGAIHRSSLPRRLMGRLIEYTGMSLVLSELILLLRLSFRLDAVSPTNGFVSWILTTSGWMVKPFNDIFSNHIIRGGGTFEPGNLIAIFVYLVGGLLIIGGLALAASRLPRRTRRARYVQAGSVQQ
jgi:hypothetical protein